MKNRDDAVIWVIKCLELPQQGLSSFGTVQHFECICLYYKY